MFWDSVKKQNKTKTTAIETLYCIVRKVRTATIWLSVSFRNSVFPKQIWVFFPPPQTMQWLNVFFWPLGSSEPNPQPNQTTQDLMAAYLCIIFLFHLFSKSLSYLHFLILLHDKYSNKIPQYLSSMRYSAFV